MLVNNRNYWWLLAAVLGALLAAVFIGSVPDLGFKKMLITERMVVGQESDAVWKSGPTFRPPPAPFEEWLYKRYCKNIDGTINKLEEEIRDFEERSGRALAEIAAKIQELNNDINFYWWFMGVGNTQRKAIRGYLREVERGLMITLHNMKLLKEKLEMIRNSGGIGWDDKREIDKLRRDIITGLNMALSAAKMLKNTITDSNELANLESVIRELEARIKEAQLIK